VRCFQKQEKKGDIDLSQATSVTLAGDLKTPSRTGYRFQINTPVRVFIIEAATIVKRTQWIEGKLFVVVFF